MRILVAYDGSSAAKAAVQRVLQRPWPAQTQVRVVTVVEWPFAFEPPYPDGPGPAVDKVRAMMIEKAKRSLAEAIETFSTRTDLDVTSELREGSPKHSLLDVIEKWKPDLVMVGSTGKSSLKRLLLGSVCHALVTHSPYSVEVVKATIPQAEDP